MKIPIRYCDKNVELELPDSWRVDLYDLPQRRLTPLDQTHWINSGALPESLSKFLTESQKLLIIVNDHFRPTPTAKILKALANSHPLDAATFLVATGIHDATSENALRAVFSELYPRLKDRIRVHSAYDSSQLASFGSGEQRILLNRVIAECDSILIIGSVEPHYFAGFTGGRKIILPGCASFDDIARNHALALSPQSRPLARQGNPVWLDIQERTSCLNDRRRFAIQIVCDHHQAVYYTSMGDWDAAHAQACDFVQAHYGHVVDEQYDVVICVAYPPLDRNLYQLQKSYENVAGAVRDGGSILLLSSCREGAGDYRFLNLAERAAKGEELPVTGSDGVLMGMHKVKRTEALAGRIDLILVSELPADQLRFLPIKPGSDIMSTLKELTMRYGTNCSVAVVLDSATQVLSRREPETVVRPLNLREESHA